MKGGDAELIDDGGFQRTKLSPTSLRCDNRFIGQHDAPLMPEAAAQVVVFHQRPVRKTSNAMKQFGWHEQSLVALKIERVALSCP